MNVMYGTDITPLQGFKIFGDNRTCQSCALPCPGTHRGVAPSNSSTDAHANYMVWENRGKGEGVKKIVTYCIYILSEIYSNFLQKRMRHE